MFNWCVRAPVAAFHQLNGVFVIASTPLLCLSYKKTTTWNYCMDVSRNRMFPLSALAKLLWTYFVTQQGMFWLWGCWRRFTQGHSSLFPSIKGADKDNFRKAIQLRLLFHWHYLHRSRTQLYSIYFLRRETRITCHFRPTSFQLH